MRIVSADWKGNLDWWSRIKIQGAGIWAVIMRPYMNICIHLFNLGEDVSHKYKHWRNIMETYTKRWHFSIIIHPTFKKNEYKTWFSIWDCRREWFCPDLNGVTQIASTANCILPNSQSLFHIQSHHHLTVLPRFNYSFNPVAVFFCDACDVAIF